MANLKPIGRILGVLGGIIMVVVGIIIVINNVMELALDLGLIQINAAAEVLQGGSWLVSAAIMLVCGIVAIYGYKELGGKKKEGLLLWGIIYIVVAIVGGGIGALLVLIAGILLLLDYFI